MRTSRHIQRNGAFTLVEIMIVVAFIGLLTALSIPSFVKARKQSQGVRILHDAKIIDTAVASWALEMNKRDGDSVDMDGVATYIKAGKLHRNDVLGNPYGIGPVGQDQVRVHTATKAALSNVGIDWGGY